VSNERSVLLLADFDDGPNAHAAQRRRALERLGLRVATFDLSSKPSLLERLRAGDLPRRLERAIQDAAPDLILTFGSPLLDEPLVDRLRAQSRARWVVWLPDDLRTAHTAAALARPYDQIYAIGTDVAADIADRLGRTVDVLAVAADPSVYRPIRTKDQYRANVVFAGAATPRRERLLGEVAEFGLAIWGPGWRQTSLRDYCRGEVASTEEYVNAYGGATVAINIHHVLVEGDPHEAACNQRLFELAAMGAAQVVDERGDLPRYFRGGDEVLPFHDAAELREHVRELVENPAEAERLGQAARARLLRDHTYMHRLRHLLLEQPRPMLPA
jgi:spore maturation protein CgeB